MPSDVTMQRAFVPQTVPSGSGLDATHSSGGQNPSTTQK